MLFNLVFVVVMVVFGLAFVKVEKDFRKSLLEDMGIAVDGFKEIETIEEHFYIDCREVTAEVFIEAKKQSYRNLEIEEVKQVWGRETIFITSYYLSK